VLPSGVIKTDYSVPLSRPTLFIKGFKLPHLSTNLGTEDEVCDRNELKEAAHKAILVDGLSNASLRVARSDVGYDADSAIVEATEQTVLKLCPRHRSLVRSRSLGTYELTATTYAHITSTTMPVTQ